MVFQVRSSFHGSYDEDRTGRAPEELDRHASEGETAERSAAVRPADDDVVRLRETEDLALRASDDDVKVDPLAQLVLERLRDRATLLVEDLRRDVHGRGIRVPEHRVAEGRCAGPFDDVDRGEPHSEPARELRSRASGRARGRVVIDRDEDARGGQSLGPLAHHEHRDRAPPRQLLRDAPEEEPTDGAPGVRAHDHHVSPVPRASREDLFRGPSLDHVGLDPSEALAAKPRDELGKPRARFGGELLVEEREGTHRSVDARSRGDDVEEPDRTVAGRQGLRAP